MAEKLKPSKEITCPDWMLTMGDCMSLMLTFFVLLLSFSSVNENQLMDVMGCVKGALGIINSMDIGKEGNVKKGSEDKNAVDSNIPGEESTLVDPESMSQAVLKRDTVMKQFDKFKENKLTTLGFENYVTYKSLTNGVMISIDYEALFLNKKIRKEGAIILQGIANMASGNGNEIRVLAAFSNDEPQWDGEVIDKIWDESRDLAITVGKFLNKNFNIAQSRLGYGVSLLASGERKRMDIVLMDKMGVREVSLKDLLNSNSSKGKEL